MSNYNYTRIMVVRMEEISLDDFSFYEPDSNNQQMLTELKNSDMNKSYTMPIVYKITLDISCKQFNNKLEADISNIVSSFFAINGEDSINRIEELNEYCYKQLNSKNFYIKLIRVTKFLPNNLKTSGQEKEIYSNNNLNCNV